MKTLYNKEDMEKENNINRSDNNIHTISTDNSYEEHIVSFD